MKLVLKNKPNDFYLQKEIVNEFVGLRDTRKLKSELEIAKNKFKNNNDYYSYFKLSEVVILLLNQENIAAKKYLLGFEKNVIIENLPNTKTIFYYYKGYVAHRLDENKLAENFFIQSVNSIKTNKLEKKEYLNVYVNYGNSLLRIGKYETALKVFFDVLKIIPENEKYNVYTNIGICFYNLKLLDKAEKYYTLGVESADLTNKPNCTANLAILYMEKNNYYNAEKTIKKLDFTTFVSSDSSAVFNVFGEIEQHKKNYSKAIDYYNIVVEIDKKQK